MHTNPLNCMLQSPYIKINPEQDGDELVFIMEPEGSPGLLSDKEVRFSRSKLLFELYKLRENSDSEGYRELAQRKITEVLSITNDYIEHERAMQSKAMVLGCGLGTNDVGVVGAVGSTDNTYMERDSYAITEVSNIIYSATIRCSEVNVSATDMCTHLRSCPVIKCNKLNFSYASAFIDFATYVLIKNFRPSIETIVVKQVSPTTDIAEVVLPAYKVELASLLNAVGVKRLGSIQVNDKLNFLINVDDSQNVRDRLELILRRIEKDIKTQEDIVFINALNDIFGFMDTGYGAEVLECIDNISLASVIIGMLESPKGPRELLLRHLSIVTSSLRRSNIRQVFGEDSGKKVLGLLDDTLDECNKYLRF